MVAPVIAPRPTARPSLADALDAIYADARAKIGAEDLAHIRKVHAYSKAIEQRGRELITHGSSPRAIARGISLRALRLVLEFSELGHNIMHGGYDHLPDVGPYHSERFRWALAVDPEQWRVMHHLNHHPKTGIIGQDHDLGFSTARFFPGQDWYAHHALQPLLLSVLLASPLAFSAYTSSSAVRVQGERVWRRETFAPGLALLRKQLLRDLWTLPRGAGVRAPLAAVGHPMSQVLGYDLTAFMLLIEHHAPNVEVFADPGPDETRDAYYERQLKGTTNFTPYLPLEHQARQLLEEEVVFDDPPPFEVFYGGLDTHLEHHLFPDLPCNRQREVRPLVRRVCADYGVPYNTMPIAEALPAVFRRLLPNVGPLGERERLSELLRSPRRALARVADGLRYRNPNPGRYLRRPRLYDAPAVVKEARPLACGSAVYLRLARPRGWEALSWAPGAFVSLRVVVEGASLVRQYSLLSSAAGSDLEIAVRRVPGGRVSNHLADHIRAGDRLTVVAPPNAQGGLAQPSIPARALYLAGGVGITPILAMLRRHARDAPRRAATLIYFNRSRRTTLFAEELRELADAANLRVLAFYDDEGTPRLNAGLLAPHLHDRSVDVYACAPESFLNAAERLCLDAGVAPERIHLERFTAPELVRRAPTGRSHRVRFTRSGREVEVDEGTTLLEAARDAGLAPPAGCERGLCRACACTKLSGMTETAGSAEDGTARITLCNTFARADVDVDA